MSKNFREYDDTPIRRKIKEKETELFELYMQESKESGEQSPTTYTVRINDTDVKISIDTKYPPELTGDNLHFETDIYHIQDGNYYGYEQAVFEDCIDYLCDNLSEGDWDKLAECGEIEAKEIAENYRDDMFNSDAITGNASGSYFCSTLKAEWALLGNSSLVEEAQEELEMNPDGAEARDVMVRAYLLDQCVPYAILRIQEAVKGALIEDITHREQ